MSPTSVSNTSSPSMMLYSSKEFAMIGTFLFPQIHTLNLNSHRDDFKIEYMGVLSSL